MQHGGEFGGIIKMNLGKRREYTNMKHLYWFPMLLLVNVYGIAYNVNGHAIRTCHVQ